MAEPLLMRAGPLLELGGAFLIMACTTWVGWQIADGYARRPRQLRELQTALAVLATEVEYGLTPLPEALLAAGNAAGGAVSRLFRATADGLSQGQGITAGEALARAIAATGRETALQEGDLTVLLALGGVLGASGCKDQIRHLGLARERLAGQEAKAREEQARYERLARYGGLLSGIALVLILM